MRVSRIAAIVLILVSSLPLTRAAERPSPEGDALLKPAPADHSPFLPKAEEIAQRKYPELFEGRFTGTIAIRIDLDIDGNVLFIETTQFPAGQITERSWTKLQSDAMLEAGVHDVYREAGSQGSKFIGWFGSKRNNGLYLFYRVLKWPLNPSRSVARVQEAVAKKYPAYFAQRPLRIDSDDSHAAVVTVVMNDDGAIEGAILVDRATEEELSDRKMFDRFRELGLKSDQVAYRGHTTNRGDWRDQNLSAPLLIIQYAWRRTDGDPLDEVLTSNDVFEVTSRLHLDEQQSHPPDEEFVKRYFPDIWKEGLKDRNEAAWIFFARTGQVIANGVIAESDVRAVEEQIQKQFRGVATSESASVGVKTLGGDTLTVYYVWIAADSPVVPKSARSK